MDVPHCFTKNVLNRDQLRRLLEMNEIKSMIKNRKRNNPPSETVLKRAIIQKHERKTAQIKQMGSGLVLETNGSARLFAGSGAAQVKLSPRKKGNRAKLPRQLRT